MPLPPFEGRTAALPELFRASVHPTPLPAPAWVHWNDDAARLVGLSQSDETLALLAGNHVPEGMTPVATLYAGHQFGHWVPQLGDGRAILLGERRDASGQAWEVQLKGAGPTPFSRGGDGRAVLRSAIREYLCSEAMHGLGIPTTRALALVGSPQHVYREEVETAAVLVRLAPTHLRFGSFEVLFYRRQFDELRLLADHLIDHHFPDVLHDEKRHLRLLETVVVRTAELVAAWQAVGFAHGVMNTDNMSMLGLTLDYGPFGFLDAYDPGFICNHSDDFGRYAFDQQPAVAAWNLRCLAQALLPLMTREEAIAALERFGPAFDAALLRRRRAKFGLVEEHEGDAELMAQFLKQMAESRSDHTLTFRHLANLTPDDEASVSRVRDQFLDRERFEAWLKLYQQRLSLESISEAVRREAMRRANPKYVLRNWIAEEAIRAAADRHDFGPIGDALAVLHSPFDEHPEHERLAAEPPDWGRHLAVSCSS